MDDLLGEDWQKTTKPTTSAPSNPSAFASNYSSFRASPQPPQSGISTPQSISRPSSAINGARTSTNDSFGNLLGAKSQKSGAPLSMQERQRQLLEEKRQQQNQETQLWDTLGSGRGTPEIRQPSPAAQTDEEDVLAAFSRDAPVDRASYFSPPPSSRRESGRSTPAIAQPAPAIPSGGFDDDDDPFGLSEVSRKTNGHVAAPSAAHLDNDDPLGDLGKPVRERPRQPSAESMDDPMLVRGNVASRQPTQQEDETGSDSKALSELLDMGFPADNAKLALAENGGNVQNAVGWLLQQAHAESRRQTREQTESRSPNRSSQRREQPTDRGATPAWMRQEGRTISASRKQDNVSPPNGEKDPTQVAQEFGNKLFKSAGSLWKASQKQMAKTLADFQQESDSNQPKWLQDPSTASERPSSQRRPAEKANAHPRQADMTDEAALLDAPRDRPQKPLRPRVPAQPEDSQSRGRSPAEPIPHRPSPQPRFMQEAPPANDKKPTTKLSRQQVEEQTTQAYVSPARRKRPTPKPEPQPEPEVDLFSSAPMQASPAANTKTAPARSKQAPPVSRPSPAPSKPKAPPRNIPSVSPSALSTSANHRKSGGEYYKRGDYAAAHESYTAALSPLPATHPVAIVVLTNRSLTGLKTGDAKMAVSDADRAMDIIGPGQGAGESIELGAGEGVKDMKEFYGKALMRKAEALEHMEKYGDAAEVWRQAIDAGVGGAVSLRGRDRCEKAATPQPAAPAPKAAMPKVKKTAPPAKSLGNSLRRPTITSAASAEAVKKLRAANAEADKADDEKFALADSVDAKLTAWRGGKADNLRALLQSMDVVLWPEAGWKKVGMSDLVLPNKVKIIYMKAIAKVHPDKIPQDATTEQRMISAAVFSTLNEAWDKFKTDNNL